jgi:uncharacterized membrane protein YdfJ with MMPL/SSD domain
MEDRKRKGIAARAAHWSATHRRKAILAWVAFVVVALFAGSAIGQREISDVESLDGESKAAERAIEDHGQKDFASETVMVESLKRTYDDAGFRQVVADVVDRIEAVPGTHSVESPPDDPALVSEDGRTALVNYELSVDSDGAEDKAGPLFAATAEAQRAHPGYEIAGFGDATAEKQLSETFEEDFQKAETLSIPITLLILVVAFGALVAAGIPVLLAISAVLASIGLVSIPSQLFPVDEAISSVILLIGMAVGVDYSLFYVRREREERARGREPGEALDTAAATSGRAVLISGLTVIAAMAGMFLSGSGIFIGFGIGTSLVVAVAMLGSLTVLPALMAWLGDRIDKGRIPLVSRVRRPAGESRIWGAVVSRVMRRPALSLLVAGGALVALTIPAFGMNTKVTGIDDLPEGLSTIQAYERIQDEFPSEHPPAVVAVESQDSRAPEITAAIGQLARDARDSGVSVGSPAVEYGGDGTLAVVELPLAGDGENEQSRTALAELRDDLIPAAFGTTGAEVNVAGDTAETVDFNDLMGSRLPIVFAFVLGLTFLLLLVTFRSVVIPLTSIGLNLLSVGAAYGILTLVFQHGYGADLLGAGGSDGITSWLPLFLFVVLFGLSMDYHVFILSRIKELVDRGTPTATAVEQGIRTTAGTVTSAAVVMVAVFSIFGTLSFIDMKQMGVGLAAAVLIDATVIRGVLLPATMKLLGERNWYLPRSLEWLPRLRHEPELEPARA